MSQAHADGAPAMTPQSIGGWVRHYDYEALERENAELRAERKAIRDKIPMNYLQRHDVAGATGPTENLDLVSAVKDFSEDRWKYIDRVRDAEARAEAAERKVAELEADKARLSETLTLAKGVLTLHHQAGVIVVASNTWRTIDAALSGSGSGWRLVPYLWQCKDYADGWLSYTNEDEAQAYQRDTGCAVRITYRPLPAAPQQGGE